MITVWDRTVYEIKQEQILDNVFVKSSTHINAFLTKKTDYLWFVHCMLCILNTKLLFYHVYRKIPSTYLFIILLEINTKIVWLDNTWKKLNTLQEYNTFLTFWKIFFGAKLLIFNFHETGFCDTQLIAANKETEVLFSNWICAWMLISTLRRIEYTHFSNSYDDFRLPNQC